MSLLSLEVGDTIDDLIEAAPWDKDHILGQKEKGNKNFGVNERDGRFMFFFEFNDSYCITKVLYCSIG